MIEPVRTVLLDVDGTLVDTNYLHTVAWWTAFREHGEDVVMARIHRAIGMGGDGLLAHVLPDRDESQDESIIAAHRALYAAAWPSLRVLPGARELLSSLSARGLDVVLASSAEQRELDVLRRVIDRDSCIAAATSSA